MSIRGVFKQCPVSILFDRFCVSALVRQVKRSEAHGIHLKLSSPDLIPFTKDQVRCLMPRLADATLGCRQVWCCLPLGSCYRWRSAITLCDPLIKSTWVKLGKVTCDRCQCSAQLLRDEGKTQQVENSKLRSKFMVYESKLEGNITCCREFTCQHFRRQQVPRRLTQMLGCGGSVWPRLCYRRILLRGRNAVPPRFGSRLQTLEARDVESIDPSSNCPFRHTYLGSSNNFLDRDVSHRVACHNIPSLGFTRVRHLY